jgi:WD40 repeat protein
MNKLAISTIAFAFFFYTLSSTILPRAAAQNAGAAQEPIQAGHTHDVIRVKWSPDDERFISYSGGDDYIRLWEVKSARLLWSARATFIQQKDEHYRLTNFAWSRDQSLIASGSGNGMIQVWDAQTGKLRWNVRAHAEHVNTVGFSQDGNHLVSSGLDEDEKNEIKTWSVVSGSPIRKFKADPGVVIAILVNADGTRLKAGNLRGEVSEWNSATGALIRRRKMTPCGGAGSWVRRVAFSPDLSLMSARCGEQTIVTDTTSEKVVRRVKMAVDYTDTMVFSGNGKVLSASDSAHIKVISLNDGEIREVDEFNIGHTIDLNHNGTLLAEGGGWRGASVKITEVASGKTYRLLEGHPGIIHALAFSPDGSSLASGSSDRVIRLWDPRSGSISASLYGHQESINALAFNPQGTLLVSSSKDETMKVWDAKSGALLHTIDVRGDGIWGIQAMAFSPNGKSLVTAGENASLRVWDANLWKVERSLHSREARLSFLRDENDRTSKALSVVFSPDGTQILSGHDDGTIRLWDVQTGQTIRTIKSVGRKAAHSAFTPDGDAIVCVNHDDNPIRIIDARSGEIIRNVSKMNIAKFEHSAHGESLAISPDGKTIALSAPRGKIGLWEIQSGRLVSEFDTGVSEDDIVVFSPDGKTLAAGGLNQNILLWEIKSGGLQWKLLPLPSEEEVKMVEENAKRLASLKAERERRIQQANAEVATWEGKIRISFDSYGEPIDLMNVRIAEPARPYRKPKGQSARTATGVWLRLRNDSHLPITFSTDSLYLKRSAKCGYKTIVGKFFEGLCDGTEVSIQYGIEDADGKPIPWGFDFGAISMLPPGSSVVFSVMRDHLENGRYIRILYRYQKEGEKRKLEDYGSEQWVYFKSSDLPR